MITIVDRASSRLSASDQVITTEFSKKVYGQFDNQVEAMILFGSRARGDSTSDSDMDILIVLSKTTPETIRAIRDMAVEVWLQYDIYLSTRVWSLAHWHKQKALNTSLYRNICQDGVSLLGDDR